MIIIDFDERDEIASRLFVDERSTRFDRHQSIEFAVHDRRRTGHLRVRRMVFGDIVEERIVQLTAIVRVRSRRSPPGQIIIGEKLTPSSSETERRTEKKQFLHAIGMKLGVACGDVPAYEEQIPSCCSSGSSGNSPMLAPMRFMRIGSPCCDCFSSKSRSITLIALVTENSLKDG